MQNVDDPTDFTFVEAFTDAAALARHAASPHVSSLAPRLKDLVARPSEVSRYELVPGPPR